MVGIEGWNALTDVEKIIVDFIRREKYPQSTRAIEREIRRNASISRNTTLRILRELEDRNYIYHSKVKGWFWWGRAGKITQRHESLNILDDLEDITGNEWPRFKELLDRASDYELWDVYLFLTKIKAMI